MSLSLQYKAAIVAIEQAILYEASGLRILTDSKFLINSIQKWIVNWKQNGWISSVGKPVKNKDCLKKLDELCSKISVSWVISIALNYKVLSIINKTFLFVFLILKDLRSRS